MNINSTDAGWQLTELSIRLEQWGDFKGKLLGKISFANRQNDAFTFTLSPEEAQEYISLVSKKLVSSASYLGDKLLHSLSLLPAPRTLETEEIKQETT